MTGDANANTATSTSTNIKGILLAGAIGIAWFLTLVVGLGLDLAWPPPAVLVLAVVVRGLLQTGLFIVGHDAMHGLLLPAAPRLNRLLGTLVLGLYAGLPYRACRANHLRHHSAPGTAQDPDFCAEGLRSPLLWYARFLGGYLSLPQMTVLLTAWGVLAVQTTPLHVLVFCILPLLLSSVQLFLVGTYLPHRRQREPMDHHHAVSLDLPEWLSLLACFHFGYHWEHHAYPHLAWYQLPCSRSTRVGPGPAIRSD